MKLKLPKKYIFITIICYLLTVFGLILLSYDFIKETKEPPKRHNYEPDNKMRRYFEEEAKEHGRK